MMKLNDKKRLDLVLGGLLLMLLKFPVHLLGGILGRDHSPEPRGDILFIKMQGGGSLVMAYPSILAVRERYPELRMRLLTTPSLRVFAESLSVFDEVIVINDRSLPAMLMSALMGWWKSLRADTVVDLEVYSRLTTVFSILTMARNRVGFYLESTFWRQRIHTHLIFFNRFSGVYHFYDEIARHLRAPLPDMAHVSERFEEGVPVTAGPEGRRRIAIGHTCSEMGRERMLTPAEWLSFFRSHDIEGAELVFLGTGEDRPFTKEVIGELRPHFGSVSFIDRCGELSLMESVSMIRSSDEFIGVDSALLHYARLLRKPTVSFWGPTDPMTRLRHDTGAAATVYYNKVPCSPCIHVAEEAPCSGDNRCIASLFEGQDGAGVGSEIVRISRIP